MPDPGKLHLLLCLGADFDRAYIPHLCRHYAEGLASWNVLLHSNDTGEHGARIIEEARRNFHSSLDDLDASAALHTHEWRGEFNPWTKVNRLNDLARDQVPPGEWVLYVDADEFIESPGDLESLLEQCAASGKKVVYGRMVDRFADDKKPLSIRPEDDLSVRFPHCEEYTKTALNAWTHKACLMKHEGKPLLTTCHDYSGETWQDYRRSGRPVPTIWHFKWVESTREKLRHRVGAFRRQGLGWWRESEISLEHIYREHSPGLRTPSGHPNPVDPRPHAWRPLRLGTVQRSDGDRMIIQLAEGDTARLNPSATLIWQLCDGSHTEPEILTGLRERLGVSGSIRQRDLRAVLDELMELGALEPRRGQAGVGDGGVGTELAPEFGSRAVVTRPLRLRLGLVSEVSKAFLNQVRLCLFSLRKNGGALSRVPVTLITNSEALGACEARFLAKHFAPIDFRVSPRLGAIPHTSKLNVFYSIDPSEYDVLLFMDCDTVVHRPLDHIADALVQDGAEFVCRRGGKTDRNMFVDFDALVRRFSGKGYKERVHHEGREEWPMFNSGVFLATSEAVGRIRRSAVEITYRLFNEWMRANVLERLPQEMKERTAINQIVRQNWTIEQGALALACIEAGVRVQYLDGTYNSWGGDAGFHVLHCFKSLYQFDRRSMLSPDAEDWIAEYLTSDIPGKVFLASMVREYRQAFQGLAGL